jgi:hypothetical protein
MPGKGEGITVLLDPWWSILDSPEDSVPGQLESIQR